jgi:hypothetical protein
MAEVRKIQTHNAAFSEAVTPEVDDLFSRMDLAADHTWIGMTYGWTRRRRPNEEADIYALWGALQLDEVCGEALETPTVFLHPNTNHLRYELFAGALTVQKTLPIAPIERAPLYQTLSGYDHHKESWRVEPPSHHAELIADWRKWLRSDGIKRAPVGSELHGEASILAAASYRIIMALNPARHGHTGDGLDTLVFPVEAEPWRY